MNMPNYPNPFELQLQQQQKITQLQNQLQQLQLQQINLKKINKNLQDTLRHAYLNKSYENDQNNIDIDKLFQTTPKIYNTSEMFNCFNQNKKVCWKLKYQEEIKKNQLLQQYIHKIQRNIPFNVINNHQKQQKYKHNYNEDNQIVINTKTQRNSNTYSKSKGKQYYTQIKRPQTNYYKQYSQNDQQKQQRFNKTTLNRSNSVHKMHNFMDRLLSNKNKVSQFNNTSNLNKNSKNSINNPNLNSTHKISSKTSLKLKSSTSTDYFQQMFNSIRPIKQNYKQTKQKQNNMNMNMNINKYQVQHNNKKLKLKIQEDKYINELFR